MGLFSFLSQEVAIDLGTANTNIIANDKLVVDEPSIVAIDRNTGKLIAIGEKARQMHGRTHENIRVIRPLRDGVIADFNAAELMIRGMIKMINTGPKFFSPSLKMVVGIPCGSTEVEIRAVRDSSEHAGGRDVYLIYGDDIMLESFPGQYPGITNLVRKEQGNQEKADQYRQQLSSVMRPVAIE